jgi:hypothetical protein
MPGPDPTTGYQKGFWGDPRTLGLMLLALVAVIIAIALWLQR